MTPRATALAAALLVALTCVASAGTRAAEAPGKVDLSYKVFAGGILVARTGLTVDLGHERFAARFSMEPGGLPWLFTRFKLNSRVDGLREGADVVPLRYQSEYWKKRQKRRWVEIDYSVGPVPDVEAKPGALNDGRPDVPAALRTGSLDPVTATVAMSERIARTGRCAGELAVYDGRRLFRVRLDFLGFVTLRNPPGGVDGGPAMECRMTAVKVAGFEGHELKDKRFPEELTLLVAPVVAGGPWLPVRVETDHKLGKLVATLESVTGEGFDTQRASRP